jgi:hypothetical protein
MIFHRDVEITGQVRDHKKENDEGLMHKSFFDTIHSAYFYLEFA